MTELTTAQIYPSNGINILITSVHIENRVFFILNFHKYIKICIYKYADNVNGISPMTTPTATPRSKQRRASHVPEVLIPEVDEEDVELETATSPRRIFSDDQRKLLSKLSIVDEHRYTMGVIVMLINTAVLLRFPQFYWMVCIPPPLALPHLL